MKVIILRQEDEIEYDSVTDYIVIDGYIHIHLEQSIVSFNLNNINGFEIYR